MDFSLSEDQVAVTRVLESVLDGYRSPVIDADIGYDEALWNAMIVSGVTALALPDRLGGDGLGIAPISSMLTALGRVSAVVPALSTTMFGVLPLLASPGTSTLYDDVLAGVADGGVLTAALGEVGDPLPTSPRTTAEREGDELVVSGGKRGVWNAGSADLLLVTTDLGVVVVPTRTLGVSMVRTPSSSDIAEFAVDFDRVRVPIGALVSTDLAGLHDHALVGVGVFADGLLTGAMELTAAHLSTREQFGRPLATFQAVSQQIADIYVTSRTMHLAATSAMWRLSEGLSADEDIAIMSYWLAEELPTAMQRCHHLHGGLGVDVTYPMHRYYSLAKDLARFVGGASARLDLLSESTSAG